MNDMTDGVTFEEALERFAEFASREWFTLAQTWCEVAFRIGEEYS